MVIMYNSSRYVTSGIKAEKMGKQLAWLCVKKLFLVLSAQKQKC